MSCCVFIPNLPNTKHPSECPCVCLFSLMYHHQQPPFLSGPFDSNECVHMSVVCLWFPVFQKEVSPHQSTSPDLSHVPPRLCSGDQQPHKQLFCTLPDTFCWLYSVCFVALFIMILEAACKLCYLFSTLIITVKLLNL